MASTVDLPAKGTRHMTATELHAEASRLGIPASDQITALRAAVKAELDRLWLEQNRALIAQHNAWVEEHGLPLSRYRMF